MAEIHVTGLADLQKMLDTLPAKIERNILRGALRAGVKRIKDAAVANCPVGMPSGEGRRLYGLHEGSLRDSIRVGTRSKGGVVTATVKAGGRTAKGGDVFYAHIIEFTGAVAHQVPALSLLGKVFLNIGGGVYRSAKHPGMRPKPFMRPALDQQANAAVVAAAEYMKERLSTKEGLDTSHITIEGDE